MTIYNQQVRAHNLAWALKNSYAGKPEPTRIAIVGGGITGLTIATCLLSVFPKATLFIYEKRLDLCPIQQGADHRWIHPHIYDWPNIGSLSSDSGLPFLPWTASRASDVVQTILNGFRRALSAFGSSRVRVMLGVSHIQISTGKRSIEWVGRTTIEESGFFRVAGGSGEISEFDEIMLTTGFGLETSPKGHSNISYWRNEQRSQLSLDISSQSLLISGYGDGALIDLCRASIERFRQESIINEIFGVGTSPAHTAMQKIKELGKSGGNLFDLFSTDSSGHLSAAAKLLYFRLRKDTRIFLHLGGPKGENTALSQAFSEASSFLNRLMLFLIYRCGAVTPVFGTLDDAMQQAGLEALNVVCRHGAATEAGFIALFDKSYVSAPLERLREMKVQQLQSAEPLFSPGFFSLPVMED